MRTLEFEAFTERIPPLGAPVRLVFKPKLKERECRRRRKGEWGRRKARRNKSMKVLVGVDGSSNSFAAVEFVGRLLSAERDELVLLFAMPAITFDDDRLDPAIEERARSVLSRTVLDAATERLPAAWQQRDEARCGRLRQRTVARSH